MKAILTLNTGSSSIKFSVFSVTGDQLSMAYAGLVDSILSEHPKLVLKTETEKTTTDLTGAWDSETDPYVGAIGHILSWLEANQIEIIATGSRIVHGGSQYRQPVALSKNVLAYLKTLSLLAPLHQPYNIKGVEIVAEKFPDLFQCACFDTSFHTTNHPTTQLFAIPKALTDEGIIRYGFHGISYEYIASQLPAVLPAEKVNGKYVICHLGAGASMCAVENQKSLATSLGFSALDGLPMGTRPGCIDPGVIMYLLKEKGFDYARLEKFMYKECGLLGVSGGLSSDMRTLEASDSPDAARAIDLFCYRINGWLGMLASELEGIDGLIFTGGIGENSSLVREKVCKKASWLGFKLDPQKNAENALSIHAGDSQKGIYVIPTNEEFMIAQHTYRLKGEQSLA